MGREDTSTGMAGNDGHCVGGGKDCRVNCHKEKKRMWGPLCFFTKPKRETEKGAKEKRNTAYP